MSLKHADELCLNDQWYVKTEAIARPILRINRARIRKSNRMTCYKTLLRKCCYMSYMWFKEQLIGFSFASVSFESRNQTISSIYSHVLAKLIYCKHTPSTYEHLKILKRYIRNSSKNCPIGLKFSPNRFSHSYLSLFDAFYEGEKKERRPAWSIVW